MRGGTPRLAAAAAVLGAAVTAPQAPASPGLHIFGVEAVVSHAAPDGQCSAIQQGAGFGVTCPPADPSLTGTKWQIDMRSPVPGSVIEALDWRALRYHETATSIALQVLADGALVWQVAERDVPRHPEPPKGYLVGMRGQTASLRLWQTELRRQPNRVWAFLEPRILVRDIAPPEASWTMVPAAWITSDVARVEWRVADNFGDAGLGEQRIRVAERLVWSGRVGQGSHAANLGLQGVADGVHPVRLEVDGVGTGPAAPQTATLRIDRTPPEARVEVAGLPGGRVLVGVAVADAASGVADWTLRARAPDGPAVVSSTSPGETREIDLAGYAQRGETIRFHLEVRDNAGHVGRAASALVTRPVADGPSTPVVAPAGSDVVLGPPGRIEASGVPLPDFSRIDTAGLRSHAARRYVRSGRALVPVILARYGRPFTLRGRFFHPNGRGLRRATVFLVDPAGVSHGTTLTDRRGRFSFRARPRRAGIWRAVALGRPLAIAPAAVRLQPATRVRVVSTRLRPGGALRIEGSIAPRRAARGKLVQLQFRHGRDWRPVTQTTADRRGRFLLRHRFSRAPGPYSIRMRVVIPREKGWQFAPVVASRFRVSIR